MHQLWTDVCKIIYCQIHVFAIFFVIEIRTIRVVWTDQIHDKITQVIHPGNATFAAELRTEWWEISLFARRGARRHPLKSLLPPSCFRKLSQTSRRSPHLFIKDESISEKAIFYTIFGEIKYRKTNYSIYKREEKNRQINCCFLKRSSEPSELLYYSCERDSLRGKADEFLNKLKTNAFKYKNT